MALNHDTEQEAIRYRDPAFENHDPGQLCAKTALL